MMMIGIERRAHLCTERLELANKSARVRDCSQNANGMTRHFSEGLPGLPRAKSSCTPKLLRLESHGRTRDTWRDDSECLIHRIDIVIARRLPGDENHGCSLQCRERLPKRTGG